MGKEKEQILAALPKLSQTHLREIQQVLASLLVQDVPEAKLWFEALSSALGSNQPYSKLSKTEVGKSLNRHAREAETYLQQIRGKESRRKLDHNRSRKFMADLLIADLKRRKVLPTIGILASNLGRLPEIMEGAFPGYVENNLTHLIFDRRKP